MRGRWCVIPQRAARCVFCEFPPGSPKVAGGKLRSAIVVRFSPCPPAVRVFSGLLQTARRRGGGKFYGRQLNGASNTCLAPPLLKCSWLL